MKHSSIETSPKVDDCRRALVRMINTQSLSGDLVLPQQQVLRKSLGASNDTLSAAMRSLVDLGAITRRPRVGTIISDLSKLPTVTWTVGIATIDAPERGPRAFYAYLSHVLQARLSEAGCRCVTYMRHDESGPYRKVSSFYGLEEDVEAGRLDGIVLLTNLDLDECRALRRQGIVVAHAGVWADAPCGAVADIPGFVEHAHASLVARGCRRIKIVDRLYQSIFGTEAARVCSEICPSLQFLLDSQSPLTGQGIAQRIIEGMEAPPDGLIILNDYLALDIEEECRRVGVTPPLMAVMANRQLLLEFGPRVMIYELGVDELGQAAASVVMAALDGTGAADSVTMCNVCARPPSDAMGESAMRQADREPVSV